MMLSKPHLIDLIVIFTRVYQRYGRATTILPSNPGKCILCHLKIVTIVLSSTKLRVDKVNMEEYFQRQYSSGFSANTS